MREPLIQKLPYKFKPQNKLDENEELEELTQKQKDILDNIKDFLQSETFLWNKEEFENYKFKLPETAFKDSKTIEFKYYEERDVSYEDDTIKLNPEQIESIKLRGEFSVKSTKKKVYVWKLTKWLMQ